MRITTTIIIAVIFFIGCSNTEVKESKSENDQIEKKASVIKDKNDVKKVDVGGETVAIKEDGQSVDEPEESKGYDKKEVVGTYLGADKSNLLISVWYMYKLKEDGNLEYARETKSSGKITTFHKGNGKWQIQGKKVHISVNTKHYSAIEGGKLISEDHFEELCSLKGRGYETKLIVHDIMIREKTVELLWTPDK